MKKFIWDKVINLLRKLNKPLQVQLINFSYLANLKSVRNGIEVETDLLGTLHIAGSGAGQESTASGVISDLVHLANSNDNFSEKNSKSKNELINFLSLSFQYYFYIEAEDVPGVMALITSQFAKKKIGIESIVQKEIYNLAPQQLLDFF